jgi:hypothetical protein
MIAEGDAVVSKRRFLMVATYVVVLTLLATSTAFAGEVTGKGKPTAGPDNANSICVFSGLNDDPNAPIVSAEPTAETPNGPGGRTQSYGQDVRYGLLTPAIVTPGDACRGGSNEERTR